MPLRRALKHIIHEIIEIVHGPEDMHVVRLSKGENGRVSGAGNSGPSNGWASDGGGDGRASDSSDGDSSDGASDGGAGNHGASDGGASNHGASDGRASSTTGDHRVSTGRTVIVRVNRDWFSTGAGASDGEASCTTASAGTCDSTYIDDGFSSSRARDSGASPSGATSDHSINAGRTVVGVRVNGNWFSTGTGASDDGASCAKDLGSAGATDSTYDSGFSGRTSSLGAGNGMASSGTSSLGAGDGRNGDSGHCNGSGDYSSRRDASVRFIAGTCNYGTSASNNDRHNFRAGVLVKVEEPGA